MDKITELLRSLLDAIASGYSNHEAYAIAEQLVEELGQSAAVYSDGWEPN